MVFVGHLIFFWNVLGKDLETMTISGLATWIDPRPFPVFLFLCSLSSSMFIFIYFIYDEGSAPAIEGSIPGNESASKILMLRYQPSQTSYGVLRIMKNKTHSFIKPAGQFSIHFNTAILTLSSNRVVLGVKFRLPLKVF